MKPSLLKETIKALTAINRTFVIEGAPGGGKTTLIRDVAAELNLHYIERHLPTMLVEDFGIPMPKDGSLTYQLPDWFPAKGSKFDDGTGGILCFDDRNQASPDIQKVLANICQARNLHGVPLAYGWTVVSTGNRQSDRAGANKVLSHLRNRETVLNMETDLNDWSKWALDNGVHPVVVSFIRYRPGMLHDFDPQRDSNPSPRSWVEGVSNVFGTVPYEAEYECFTGAVGEAAAAEFTGFVRIWRKLPNPDAIIMNPANVDVPEDAATLYALSGALAARASTTNFDAIVTYGERMPKEFLVLMVNQSLVRVPELNETAAFQRCAVSLSDMLF